MGGGFLGLGQAAMAQQPQQQMQMQQPQLPPQTVGTLPQGQTYTQDPRSAYLAAALQAIGQGQNAPKTGMAVGSDLLAQALDRYALSRRGQQIGFQNAGGQAAQDWSTMQNQNANAGLPSGPSANMIIPGY